MMSHFFLRFNWFSDCKKQESIPFSGRIQLKYIFSRGHLSSKNGNNKCKVLSDVHIPFCLHRHGDKNVETFCTYQAADDGSLNIPQEQKLFPFAVSQSKLISPAICRKTIKTPNWALYAKRHAEATCVISRISRNNLLSRKIGID